MAYEKMKKFFSRRKKKEKPTIGAVYKKIKQNTKNVKGLKEDDLKRYATNLGEVKALKKAYLNLEFDAIKKLYEKMQGEEENLKERKTMRLLESTGKVKHNDFATGKDLIEEGVDFEKFRQRDQFQAGEYKDKGVVKIKLIIAEIAKTSNERTFRKLLSPIATNLHLMGDYGWFHSALIIGPWYIEWNSSSLCIPRKCYSSAALLAIDVGKTITVKVKLKDIIDKLAKVIVHWNTTKHYSQQKANCQHFIDDVCKEINLKLSFKGSMKTYISSLRLKGKCDLAWKIPEEIREKCKFKDASIKFKSHEEIDTLVSKIVEQYPLFDEEYADDYKLLKAFDRAYWLRHFRNTIHTDYIPKSNEDGELLCPFGDPQNTSFAKGWW